jgi:hypothetical protein
MRTQDTPTPPTQVEAAGHVRTKGQIHDLDLINMHELQAIDNLTAWVAEEQSIAPEAVRSVTEASFGVRSIGSLERDSYDQVIRFLLDLGLGDIVN